MNIADISEVAKRKKVNEDAEKLRERVNRENAKIIKMKVAQDASYWDLKEKVRQFEEHRERLQQNLMEVQMENETLSMKYQDELRLRSETLNKVASMKAMVDVTEEYITKLSDTLYRTRCDCNALANAYANASRTVSELREQYLQLQRTKSDEDRNLSSRFLEELTAKSTSETCAAMNHVGDVLRSHYLELIKKNDEKISRLQSEVKRLTEELNTQKCEHQSVVANYKINAVEEARLADELRANVLNAEKTVTMLHDQLAAADRERLLLKQLLDDTKSEVKESTAAVERQNISLIEANKENKKFAETIAEKNQIIREQQVCIDKLNNEIAVLGIKCAETDAALTTVKLEKEAGVNKIEKMKEESSTLRKQLIDIKEEFKKHKEESERKAASTRNDITNLMGEVQNGSRVADILKTEIHTLKANAAAEQDSLRQEGARHRARADNLEITNKNKDKDISELKTIIQEKDKEIECLKNKIRAMQNTIDNIQKELTARLQVGPSQRDTCPEQSERPERDQQPKVTKNDDLNIYNFLSDSSSDFDTVHTAVINRQFDALAKRAIESLTDGEIGAGAGGDKVSIGAGSEVINSTGATKRLHGQSPVFISVSEVKKDSNTKKRNFFKTKNSTAKQKKIK